MASRREPGGDDVADRAPLEGLEVVLAGRLGSMDHATAARLVRAAGGRLARSVTLATDLVVIGRAPTRAARASRGARLVEQARELVAGGSSLLLLEEVEFLARLGRTGDGKISRFTTPATLHRLLGIGRDRLRRWVRAGLLRPAAIEDGVPQYDLRQVADIKALWTLARRGVSMARLRDELERLHSRWPELTPTPGRLHLLESGREVIVRLGDGRLASADGQLHFDFVAPPARADVEAVVVDAADRLHTPASSFDRALAHEREGRLDAAEATYRRLLVDEGPRAEVCFNLGNVLLRKGRLEAALERYAQATELDGSYAEAWNNLGVAQSELGRVTEAEASFERAVALAPTSLDAIYNLADARHRLGDQAGARALWRRYLSLDDEGSWAEHARRRLEESVSESPRDER